MMLWTRGLHGCRINRSINGDDVSGEAASGNQAKNHRPSADGGGDDGHDGQNW